MAKTSGLASRVVLRYLHSLESRGLVVHLGKRGWLPVRHSVESEPEVTQIDTNEPETAETVDTEPIALKTASQNRSCGLPMVVDDIPVIRQTGPPKSEMIRLVT